MHQGESSMKRYGYVWMATARGLTAVGCSAIALQFSFDISVDVVVGQTTMLLKQRTAISSLGRCFSAGVQLIKAVGGGWKSVDPGSNGNRACAYVARVHEERRVTAVGQQLKSPRL